MLRFINEIPTDFPIGGVHCIPILDDGNLMMVWDREEKVLTTIGGRLELNESINEGLEREVMEEAGIEITDKRTTFASWFWEETQSYTIYILTNVKRFSEIPKGYEKTGYVIMNFETAIDMIKKIEGRGERIEIIRKAGILSRHLREEGNSR
ncbi:NUDIX domain-containing protein [Paenibacillus sp. R14(2021)]|uniref:NUDIX domain-containing protein n=1 Tax=Paenibacillus sp. R14(2021) TaxID=2859228 RepID=UPI001C613645|nr:NUDIX domain-containing protein [Paenibacillus sp. R14(2021)]